MLPVTGLLYSIVLTKQFSALTQHIIYFIIRPGVKLTFHAFTVSIECRIKAAFGAGHLIINELNGLFYRLPI
jgi:hypothetical protein